MSRFLFSAFLFSGVLALGAVSPHVSLADVETKDGFVAKTILVSSDEDHAGPWEQFGPGRGRIRGNSNDWHLLLHFHTDKAVKIQSITFLHKQYGYPDEGWSTSSDYYFGKELYPIVVFNQDKKQLNSAYNQSLGTYAPGTYKLDLFAQSENPDFGGGILIVKLEDGRELQFEMGSRFVGSCLENDRGTKSIMNDFDLLAIENIELQVGADIAIEEKGKLEIRVARLAKQVRRLKQAASKGSH